MKGDDGPEDIAGGLEAALKQDWQSEVKYAVLIADSPCHGSKYNDQLDLYPKGDPKGRNVEK
jgi:hypothetical protein